MEKLYKRKQKYIHAEKSHGNVWLSEESILMTEKEFDKMYELCVEGVNYFPHHAVKDA